MAQELWLAGSVASSALDRDRDQGKTLGAAQEGIPLRAMQGLSFPQMRIH